MSDSSVSIWTMEALPDVGYLSIVTTAKLDTAMTDIAKKFYYAI